MYPRKKQNDKEPDVMVGHRILLLYAILWQDVKTFQVEKVKHAKLQESEPIQAPSI